MVHLWVPDIFCCGNYFCLAIMEGVNSVVKSRGKVQLNDQVLVHPKKPFSLK